MGEHSPEKLKEAYGDQTTTASIRKDQALRIRCVKGLDASVSEEVRDIIDDWLDQHEREGNIQHPVAEV